MIGGARMENLVVFAHAKIGHLVPAPLRKWLRWVLYPSGSAQPKMLVIDTVGACNLRCPSCAVGNMGVGFNPTGIMDIELFRSVIKKAKHDHGVRVVALFNWSEPFLNPRLAQFVGIVKAENMRCTISSNLNLMRDVDSVLEAGLDIFRVSLSGFTQENYGQSHVRGDIDKVKANMRLLRAAIDRTRTKPIVEVYFHKYLHNLGEVEQMRALVVELHFSWLENWAYYMPMEKVLAAGNGELSATEQKFVDEKLALPITEALAAAGSLDGYDRCTLLEDQIVLDHNANVLLCCTVYDFKNNGLGTFMEMSEADLKRMKSCHPTCTTCTSKGLQKYFTYSEIPELRDRYDALAKAKVASRQLNKNTA